jgi:hypothetical protein
MRKTPAWKPGDISECAKFIWLSYEKNGSKTLCFQHGFKVISNHAKLITVIASEAIARAGIASFRFAAFAMTLCN